MNMRMTFIAALTLALALAFAAPAMAETEKSASASASVMSQYVWRGIALSNGVVMQPSVDFNYGSLNVNMWSNIDMDPMGTEQASAYNETDLTIAYALPVEAVDSSIGYIYYAIGDPEADTHEVYLSVAKELGPVTPYLTVYVDVDEGSGVYAKLGADFAKELSEKASLSVGAYISYVMDNGLLLLDANGEETSDLYNAEIMASVEYDLGDGLTITPAVAYSASMSDDAKASIKAISYDGDTESVAYGGVTVSLGF